MAIVMTPTTAAAMGSVPIDKAGVGSAVLNSMRQVGGRARNRRHGRHHRRLRDRCSGNPRGRQKASSRGTSTRSRWPRPSRSSERSSPSRRCGSTGTSKNRFSKAHEHHPPARRGAARVAPRRGLPPVCRPELPRHDDGRPRPRRGRDRAGSLPPLSVEARALSRVHGLELGGGEGALGRAGSPQSPIQGSGSPRSGGRSSSRRPSGRAARRSGCRLLPSPPSIPRSPRTCGRTCTRCTSTWPTSFGARRRPAGCRPSEIRTPKRGSSSPSGSSPWPTRSSARSCRTPGPRSGKAGSPGFAARFRPQDPPVRGIDEAARRADASSMFLRPSRRQPGSSGSAAQPMPPGWCRRESGAPPAPLCLASGRNAR